MHLLLFLLASTWTASVSLACLFAPAPGVMEESSRLGDVRPGRYRETIDGNPYWTMTLRADGTGVSHYLGSGPIPMTWTWNRSTRVLRMTLIHATCRTLMEYKLDSNLRGKMIRHDWLNGYHPSVQLRRE